MAVFGLPKVHEDDALRAVRAAEAMQLELKALNVELEQTYGVTLANRIGVNTGGVVAGDATTNQRLVTGDPSTSPRGWSRRPATPRRCSVSSPTSSSPTPSTPSRSSR